MEDILKNLDLILIGLAAIGGFALFLHYYREEDAELEAEYRRGLKLLGQRPGYKVEFRSQPRERRSRSMMEVVVNAPGWRVEIYNSLSRAEEREVRFTTTLSGEVPLDLELKKKGVLGGGEFALGDQELDQKLAISGGWTKEQLARLGAASLRPLLLEAVEDFAMKLEERELSFTFAGYPSGEGGTLAAVDKFVALAGALEGAIAGR